MEESEDERALSIKIEGVDSQLRSVQEKEAEIEKALKGEGSYLGSLVKKESDVQARAELLFHLRGLHDEKRQLRDEKRQLRGDKKRMEYVAYQAQEKEVVELRLKLVSATTDGGDMEGAKRGRGGSIGGSSSSSSNSSNRRGGRQHLAFSPYDRAAEVHDCIIDYVGEGQHIFISAVSKEWRNSYIAVHPPSTQERSIVESIDRLYWARSQGYQLTLRTICTAAKYGSSLRVCKALYHMGCPYQSDQVCLHAAANDKYGLRIIKWARTDPKMLADKAWNAANCLTTEVCKTAAGRGNLEMLKWLLGEAGAPFDIWVWKNAVKGNHIPILEYLVSHPSVQANFSQAAEGTPWRSGSHFAAQWSSLEVLQWLHKNARAMCDWNGSVCQFAVEVGKQPLEKLQWLRSEEVNCAWDQWSCPVVLKNYRLSEPGGQWRMDEEDFSALTKWVHENGHPCDCPIILTPTTTITTTSITFTA